MTLEELKQVPILECEIIFPQKDRDPVYANCVKKNITMVGDLLSSYETGAFICKKGVTKLQLKGVIDLLQYKYFENVSEAFISILNKIVNISKDAAYNSELWTFSPKSSDDITRLGLFNKQKQYLEIFFKEDVSDNKLIYYIEKAYEELKEKRFYFTEAEHKNTLCKFQLLIKMYHQAFEKKEAIEKKSSIRNEDIINRISLEELKQIPIYESGIILPKENEDPVYNVCTNTALTSIGDFFTFYKETEFASVKNFLSSFYTKAQIPCVLMQLKGIFDLLHFKYFEENSKELIHILEKHFILYVNQDPVVSIDLLSRLGFSPAERECLTAYLISQNKGIVSTEPLIHYLANLFHEIKAGQYILPLSIQEITIFENKISLLVCLYKKDILSKTEIDSEPEGVQQLKMEKH